MARFGFSERCETERERVEEPRPRLFAVPEGVGGFGVVVHQGGKKRTLWVGWATTKKDFHNCTYFLFETLIYVCTSFGFFTTCYGDTYFIPANSKAPSSTDDLELRGSIICICLFVII